MAAERDFKHRAQGSGPGAAKRSRKNEGARTRASARPADERGPRQSSRRGRATLFAFGILLGFAAGIAVMVFDVPDRIAARNDDTPPITDGHGGRATDAVAAERAKVEFEFYDNLPELTVLLDARDLEPPTAAPEPPRPQAPTTPLTQSPAPRETAAPRPTPAPQAGNPDGAAPVREAVPSRSPQVDQRKSSASTPMAAPQGATKTRYLMQVASFRQIADAEKTRATLGFAGLRARIVSVSLDDGTQRHRVQLEPVTGEARLKAVREALRHNGFSEPLVVRIKQG